MYGIVENLLRQLPGSPVIKLKIYAFHVRHITRVVNAKTNQDLDRGRDRFHICAEVNTPPTLAMYC